VLFDRNPTRCQASNQEIPFPTGTTTNRHTLSPASSTAPPPPHLLAPRAGGGILTGMRILGHRTRSRTAVRVAVALMQLAFVTWLPAAHLQSHIDDLPLRAPPQEGGHPPASDLASECFVCAASLGAGTPASVDLAIRAAVSPSPETPLPQSHPVACLCAPTHSARAPPTLSV
jgi:hypothetical protein